MEWLIEAFTSAVLNWIGRWYKAKKAQADEWNARSLEAMLESVKDADKLSIEIRESEAVGVESPAAWNKAITVVLFVAVFVSGCIVQTVTVEGKMPIIAKPKRPSVGEIQPFTEREKKLAVFAGTLEARIDAYNQAAHERNRRNGFEE